MRTGRGLTEIVIRVITPLFFFCLLTGCGQDKQWNNNTPESISHSTAGKLDYISPRALVDSLNRGKKLNLFFLEGKEPEEEEHIVQLPGMISLPIGNMLYVRDTLSTDQTIYLVSLYGIDAKTIGKKLAGYGYNCFYLDGGSFRLWQQIQRHGWIIFPRIEK